MCTCSPLIFIMQKNQNNRPVDKKQENSRQNGVQNQTQNKKDNKKEQ